MKRKILLRNKKKVQHMGWKNYTKTFYAPNRNMVDHYNNLKMAIDFAIFLGYRKRVVRCPMFLFGRTRKSSVCMVEMYAYMYGRTTWELNSGKTLLEGMLKSEDDIIEVFVYEKNLEVQK